MSQRFSVPELESEIGIHLAAAKAYDVLDPFDQTPEAVIHRTAHFSQGFAADSFNNGGTPKADAEFNDGGLHSVSGEQKEVFANSPHDLAFAYKPMGALQESNLFSRTYRQNSRGQWRLMNKKTSTPFTLKKTNSDLQGAVTSKVSADMLPSSSHNHSPSPQRPNVNPEQLSLLVPFSPDKLLYASTGSELTLVPMQIYNKREHQTTLNFRKLKGLIYNNEDETSIIPTLKLKAIPKMRSVTKGMSSVERVVQMMGSQSKENKPLLEDSYGTSRGLQVVSKFRPQRRTQSQMQKKSPEKPNFRQPTIDVATFLAQQEHSIFELPNFLDDTKMESQKRVLSKKQYLSMTQRTSQKGRKMRVVKGNSDFSQVTETTPDLNVREVSRDLSKTVKQKRAIQRGNSLEEKAGSVSLPILEKKLSLPFQGRPKIALKQETSAEALPFQRRVNSQLFSLRLTNTKSSQSVDKESESQSSSVGRILKPDDFNLEKDLSKFFTRHRTKDLTAYLRPVKPLFRDATANSPVYRQVIQEENEQSAKKTQRLQASPFSSHKKGVSIMTQTARESQEITSERRELYLRLREERSVTIKDWADTPLHRLVTEQTDHAAALLKSLPRQAIVNLCKLEHNVTITDPALVKLLKQKLSTTLREQEVDYSIMIAKREEIVDLEEMEALYKRAETTFQVLMYNMGQLTIFEHVNDIYRAQKKEDLKETLLLLLSRCAITYDKQNRLSHIFSMFHKHQQFMATTPQFYKECDKKLKQLISKFKQAGFRDAFQKRTRLSVGKSSFHLRTKNKLNSADLNDPTVGIETQMSQFCQIATRLHCMAKHFLEDKGDAHMNGLELPGSKFIYAQRSPSKGRDENDQRKAVSLPAFFLFNKLDLQKELQKDCLVVKAKFQPIFKKLYLGEIPLLDDEGKLYFCEPDEQ